jgi:GNAT superfamily N-acetyltransferase
MTVAQRPATPADSEFCYQLHKAAMGDYITAVWGWDELVQRAFHIHAFTPHRWRVITVEGADIGAIDVEHRPGESYLARIEIHPGYQGRGIGAQLISTLIDEAEQKGQGLGPGCTHHQPPRPGPLPAAGHDRNRQARRRRDHNAVRRSGRQARRHVIHRS